MPHFTVRVELHDAQRVDYNTLQAAMSQRGFSRLITSDDGRRYELPSAEFEGFVKLTTMQVLGVVQNAAAATGKRNSILVTEVKSRAWSGLSIVKVPEVIPCFEEASPATNDQGFPADDWA
jgi:hypothetical protein